MYTLVQKRLDMSIFEGKYCNDGTRWAADDPEILLKVVLLAYSRGLIPSRKIEQACRENVIFMALGVLGSVLGYFRHAHRCRPFCRGLPFFETDGTHLGERWQAHPTPAPGGQPLVNYPCPFDGPELKIGRRGNFQGAGGGGVIQGTAVVQFIEDIGHD
jgi:hypothetical protein